LNRRPESGAIVMKMINLFTAVRITVHGKDLEKDKPLRCT